MNGAGKQLCVFGAAIAKLETQATNGMLLNDRNVILTVLGARSLRSGSQRAKGETSFKL